MVPEIWNPVTGEKVVVANYTDDGTITTLPIKMDPFGSRFVVFRPGDTKNAVAKLTQDGQPVLFGWQRPALHRLGKRNLCG